MNLTIKLAKTIHASDGQKRYIFEPNEMRVLLRNNFAADVAIVDESGEEIRVFNTKDYLAAMAFFHLQQ
jgi:hypothetical protein